MQQATRYAFWVVAAILLGAGLINALQQITGTESFSAVVPCVLALGGLGFGYLGMLFVIPPGGASSCNDEGEEAAEETQDGQT